MRDPGKSTEDDVLGTLDSMRSLEPPPPNGAAAAQRRQRMTRAMRVEMDGAAGSGVPIGWLRRLGWGVLVVGAATVALVFVVGRDRGQSAGTGVATAATGVAVIEGALTIENAGVARRLAAGEQRSVGERDVLETSATESVEFRVADVGRVTLAPSSRVVAVGAAPGGAGGAVDRMTLVTGRAHLSIAKLRTGRTFRVMTSAATVRVHGTEFDVEIAPGATPRTCVRVQDGLVEVIAGAEATFLKPGQTWGCDGAGGVPAAAGAAAVGQGASPAPSSPLPLPRAGAATGAGQVSGELRMQNLLFEQALRAERAGHHARAADLYRHLLDRYPRGPLAPQAKSHLSTLPHAATLPHPNR